jgi:hypothetical protein
MPCYDVSWWTMRISAWPTCLRANVAVRWIKVTRDRTVQRDGELALLVVSRSLSVNHSSGSILLLINRIQTTSNAVTPHKTVDDAHTFHNCLTTVTHYTVRPSPKLFDQLTFTKPYDHTLTRYKAVRQPPIKYSACSRLMPGASIPPKNREADTALMP